MARNDDTAKRGRPADPTIDAAVRSAVEVELSQRGWRAVSIERVAARAGVARTTLYRRYGSAHGLILLVMDAIYEDVPVADTGGLRGDLVALMRDVQAVWRRPEHVRYLSALLAATHESPQLAAAYAAQFSRRRVATTAIISRARQRGELRADADGELLLDLLAGVVAQRVLLRQVRLEPGFADQVVDALLTGFRAGS